MAAILFVDARVPDYQGLIDALDPSIEWIVLEANRDGVEQMRAALAGRSGLAAIHIVSHGGEGALYLGNAVLDSGTLENYAGSLRQIGQSLTEAGDLLLYGCNVAQGNAGQQFIAALAQATGADVAASTNLTGALAQGADWLLEAQSGPIESIGAIDTIAQADYHATLDVVNGSVGNDNLIGTAGDDTISGGAGNDTIDGGTGNDIAVFSGNAADYSIGLDVAGNAVLQITDLNTADGNDGIDLVSNVETLQFADRGFTLDVVGRGEFRANTYTIGVQYRPSATALSGGGFVVTWMSVDQDGTGHGVYGQRYGATGVAQGAEFRVNSHTGSEQRYPSVTALVDGGFVVAWDSSDQDGSGYGIYGQRYDATGVALGAEFRVNAFTNGNQFQPSVTALSGGGFVVTWESDANQDGSGIGIYGQRFDATGVAQGGAFRVNTNTSGDQNETAVTGLNGGGFVVTWTSNGQDGSGLGVYGQRFDATGMAQGTEFKVNSYTSGDQNQTAVAGLSGGGFVVTWTTMGEDGSLGGVYGQRYDATGVAQGAEFGISTFTSGNQYETSVTALSGGGFVVTWQSTAQDGSSNGIYGQRYEATGVAQGTEFRVNTYTTSDQDAPSVTALSDGGFVVTWQSTGQDGSSVGVYGQRYDANGNPVGLEVLGTSGDDSFIAATGIVLFAGGSGNDTYTVTDSVNTIRELPNEGTDTVLSTVTYTISSNVENLTLTGITAINGTGNTDHNTLTGNSADNRLDGLAGNDTLSGGTGNDTYVVDSSGDVIVEGSNAGTDLVESNVSWTLGPNLENLTLTGSSNISGTGNDSGNNRLTGNSGNNTLEGKFGNDTLDGGSGNDIAVFSGNAADYSIGVEAAGNAVLQITDLNTADGNDGIDLVSNVETLQFADRSFNLDVVGRGEFRANTYTSNLQYGPTNAALSGGGFVVTWMSIGQDGAGHGVYGQRYEPTGVAQGAEFRVNSHTTGEETFQSATALSGGGFVVVWGSQSSQDGSGAGVYGQRYDATGVALGAEFRVNTFTSANQYYPSVTALSGAGFVVTWESDTSQDGSGIGIYAQRYDGNGVAQGAEFKVNSYTSGDQTNAAITGLSGGGFVATWTSDGQDGSGLGVYGQRYDAAGVAQGSEFRVNTYTNGAQSLLQSEAQSPITGLSGGGFVVTWASDGQDGSILGVYGQRYDAAGVAQGAEFRVNTFTSGHQYAPSVTGLSDGGFVVTWQSQNQDGNGYGVYGQRYDATGVAQGAEFRVNTYTTSDQFAASVSALSDGGFVVTWQSQSQDGSAYGIYGQRYDANGNPVGLEVLGTSGNDNFVAGIGPILFAGGIGNDTYTVTDSVNRIRELPGEGTESVNASATYTLSANLESLTLTGNASINGTGSLDNNTLTGNGAANRLDGAAGDDTLIGGAGNDTLIGGSGNDSLSGGGDDDLYSVDSPLDVIVEGVNAGIDSVESSVTWTLDSNLEHLTLTGTGDINGTANAGNNRLTGNSGNNTLDAQAGNDTIDGGAGNDSIFAGEGNDSVLGGVGNDSIVAADGDDSVSGGDGDDTIIAGAGNDSVQGNSGNDQLNGGFGNDTLDGGSGSDTAVYSGNATDYRIAISSGNDGSYYTVTDLNVADGDEGVDLLLSVESLQFADRTYSLNELASGERRVNTTTANSQQAPVSAALNDGSYVIAWQSAAQDGSDYGIYAQRYDSSGLQLGTEFRVNTTTSAAQAAPTIAALSGGGFVIAWQSSAQDTSLQGVYAQRFDAAGSALGVEFKVNSYTLNDQQDPAISALSNGGFIISWESSGQDGSNYGVYAQRYNASGTAVGAETQINTTVANTQLNATSASLSNGDTVISWQSDLQDGSTNGIYAQRYNSSGVAQGSEYRVNTTTSGEQQNPAITPLSTGGHVVSWQSQTQDGNGWGIYAQHYDANGAATGSEFRVNTTVTSDQITPALSALSGGSFIAVWASSGQDASGYGIYAQRYDANGAALGSEIRINTNISSDQIEPAVSGLTDGSFVISWSSLNQDGSGYGVYQQRFDANGNPAALEVTATPGADVLNSGSGITLMIGGAGNDSYGIDETADLIRELLNEGSDTVTTPVSYTLNANIENLTLTGTGNVNATGNSDANVITGNSGNNRVEGGVVTTPSVAWRAMTRLMAALEQTLQRIPVPWRGIALG